VGGAGAGISPAGGAAAANAADVGNLLQRSDQAQGVEVQQRNSVIVDPRIRGYRTGQYLTTADGAAFFPARLDLDTPVSKFDPGSIRDVRVIRGPYTSLLGPALSFLDIATADTPRATNGCGIEYHGRTALGYQTNGQQWNALQGVSAAGENWGFRGSYNWLNGVNYHDGFGDSIPAHYTVNNINYAFGFDLTDRSSLEFKGLRVRQSNVELPGLYFDTRQADTEAYDLRYRVKDLGVFNEVSFNLWYNTTVGRGDTLNQPKQLFVDTLLQQSFQDVRPGVPFSFHDQSTTRFGERSIGYRLAGVWGNNKDELTVTAGTDLNVFGQGLIENINFTQLGVPGSVNLMTNQPLNSGVGPTFNQDQSIPNSQSVDPGLFIEAMLPLDKRLKLRSGGRLDWVRTSADPRLISGNINLFGAPGQTPGLVVPSTNPFVIDPIQYSTNPALGQSLSRDFTLFNGFATAEYLVTDTTTLFLNYGHGERAPTLTELYAAGPFIGVLQQGTSRLIGDPNLKKESLNQIDAGLRADYDWIKIGITGFYAFINNYITYDANKLSNNGLTQIVYTNTDLATLAGTEAFVTVNLTDWLSPFATLSYVQGVDQTHADTRRPADLFSSRRDDPATRTFAAQTEALPQIPPMEARAGFRIHQACKDPKWQIELMARMVAGQNNVATSLGELPTPGFTTYNIRGYWQVTRAWMLTAGVENIGDILYREHLDPISSTLLHANVNPLVAPLYRPGINYFFSSQLTY
jgi:outer membrane receptor protein involved in Fe transport